MRDRSPRPAIQVRKPRDTVVFDITENGNSAEYRIGEKNGMRLRYENGQTRLDFRKGQFRFSARMGPNESIPSIGQNSGFRTDQSGRLVAPFLHPHDPELRDLSPNEKSAILDILLGTPGVIPRYHRRASPNASASRSAVERTLSHHQGSTPKTKASTQNNSIFAADTKEPSERQEGEDSASEDYAMLFATLEKMTENCPSGRLGRIKADPERYEELFAGLHEMISGRTLAGSTAWTVDDPDL